MRGPHAGTAAGGPARAKHSRHISSPGTHGAEQAVHAVVHDRQANRPPRRTGSSGVLLHSGHGSNAGDQLTPTVGWSSWPRPWCVGLSLQVSKCE